MMMQDVLGLILGGRQGTRLYPLTKKRSKPADGCRVDEAEISNSVIGLRSIIGSHVTIRDSIIMGADRYETEEDQAHNKRLGHPNVGIGEGSVIEAAIIDKNVRIDWNVRIRHLPNRPDDEAENWVAREGLVVIPKSAVILDHTVI